MSNSNTWFASAEEVINLHPTHRYGGGFDYTFAGSSLVELPTETLERHISLSEKEAVKHAVESALIKLPVGDYFSFWVGQEEKTHYEIEKLPCGEYKVTIFE